VGGQSNREKKKTSSLTNSGVELGELKEGRSKQRRRETRKGTLKGLKRGKDQDKQNGRKKKRLDEGGDGVRAR